MFAASCPQSKLPGVKFGSLNGVGSGPTLAAAELFLCSETECKISVDVSSKTEYLEVLENFAGTAEKPGHNPRSHADSIKPRIKV